MRIGWSDLWAELRRPVRAGQFPFRDGVIRIEQESIDIAEQLGDPMVNLIDIRLATGQVGYEVGTFGQR